MASARRGGRAFQLSWTSALIGIGNRFVLQPFAGDLPGRIKPFHCVFGQFDAQAEAHGTKEPSRCFGRAVHCWNLVLGICQSSTEQGHGLYYGSLPVGGKKWRNDFPIKSRTGLEKLLETLRYRNLEIQRLRNRGSSYCADAEDTAANVPVDLECATTIIPQRVPIRFVDQRLFHLGDKILRLSIRRSHRFDVRK